MQKLAKKEYRKNLAIPQQTNRLKKKQGPTGVEPVTYRAATDCSTTELQPLEFHPGLEPGVSCSGGRRLIH